MTRKIIPGETHLNEQEAANYLNVSLSGLRKWRTRRVGPRYCRFGRLIRYRQSDLDAWVDARSSKRDEMNPQMSEGRR